MKQTLKAKADGLEILVAYDDHEGGYFITVLDAAKMTWNRSIGAMIIDADDDYLRSKQLQDATLDAVMANSANDLGYLKTVDITVALLNEIGLPPEHINDMLLADASTIH